MSKNKLSNKKLVVQLREVIEHQQDINNHQGYMIHEQLMIINGYREEVKSLEEDISELYQLEPLEMDNE